MVQTNLPQQPSRTLPHTPVTVSEIKFTDVHRVHLKDLFLKQSVAGSSPAGRSSIKDYLWSVLRDGSFRSQV